ncbi:MAG: N-acetylneuraminate synthase family protein [Planctomycetes bacterium]|nr:N-acetylneuraminate synthase family protein [Planctomycetota bacterium]
MNSLFAFEGLFVLDLANNHQGDAEHGANVVRAMGDVVRGAGVRAALKFQYRNLETFIHAGHKEASTNRHVDRFLSTQLTGSQFGQLADEVHRCGMITMATPFDEESVDLALQHEIEILKIASCSATDWPLLERVSEANKPVIFSTAGLDWEQIDNLVSFFDHRRVQFAIMHCVAIYPTPSEHLELNQIGLLRRRYPGKAIGFSTHEDPDSVAPAHVAVAKGAQLLERHVGLETDTIKLNKYSSTPEQIERWIRAAQEARTLSGASERPPARPEEIESLRSLQRGVYVRRPIRRGRAISRTNVYFAMPLAEGQLSAGEWKEGIDAATDVGADQPITAGDVRLPDLPEHQRLIAAVHAMKAMLNESQIALPPTFETEFSHHRGVSRFHEVGATFVTYINREYCKKLIIQLPGQKHPPHYHKSKEETFVVLNGTLQLDIEGRRYTLYPGDVQLVQQGVWHEFWTEKGVIFEEISSQDVSNDSFYEDKDINRMRRSDRKTRVNQWGRYQIRPDETKRNRVAA